MAYVLCMQWPWAPYPPVGPHTYGQAALTYRHVMYTSKRIEHCRKASESVKNQNGRITAQLDASTLKSLELHSGGALCITQNFYGLLWSILEHSKALYSVYSILQLPEVRFAMSN